MYKQSHTVNVRKENRQNGLPRIVVRRHPNYDRVVRLGIIVSMGYSVFIVSNPKIMVLGPDEFV